MMERAGGRVRNDRRRRRRAAHNNEEGEEDEREEDEGEEWGSAPHNDDLDPDDVSTLPRYSYAPSYHSREEDSSRR